MSLSVAALRQRTATALAAVSGFNESPHLWDVFGADPSALMHRGFAVGTPRSVWTGRGRQKVSVGSHDETTLSVRHAFKVRIKDQRQSYDDALADGRTIIQTVVAMSRADITGGPTFNEQTLTALSGGEWLLLEITFAAQHLTALE
jgi:hypothetical protein